MQDIGSVQNLDFLKVVGFCIGLSLRTMQDFSSVQNLDFLNDSRVSPLTKVRGIDLMLEALRTARATDTSKGSPE